MSMGVVWMDKIKCPNCGELDEVVVVSSAQVVRRHLLCWRGDRYDVVVINEKISDMQTEWHECPRCGMELEVR
jgi:hypothetical protein